MPNPLQAGAGAVASSSASLTTWSSVTLAAPLYTGYGGALDPRLWQDGARPIVGSVVYYDGTYITIAPSGEIASTQNNIQAVVQFNPGLGTGFRDDLIILSSGLSADADIEATAGAALANQLTADARADSTGSATLAGTTMDSTGPTFDSTLMTMDGGTSLEADGSGVGTGSATLADTTPPSWPGSSGLTVGTISAISAMASWSAATDNVGVTGYKLRLTPSGSSPVVIDIRSSSAFYGLVGLSPSTTYLLEVAAYDAAGNLSAYQSGTATFTTLRASAQESSAMYVFGAGSLYATPQFDALGNAITTPTPLQFGVLQDVAMSVKFDSKKLYGNQSFPVASGRGKGTISLKAKYGKVDGRIWSSLFWGQATTTGQTIDYTDTTGSSIPGTSPYTITPTVPSSGTWAKDLGVLNAAGIPLTYVTGTPATGQYAVSAGVYTFAAADEGTKVFINFQYTLTTASALQSTIVNEPMGYTPSFSADFTNTYAGKIWKVTFFNVQSNSLDTATKQDDFMIQEADFDVLADSQGRVLAYSVTDV